MYVIDSPFKIKEGTSISVTSSAAQETALGNGIYVAISNIGTEVAYINTNDETATAASLPIFIGETKSPIYLPAGTINHIGDGNTTLVVNELAAFGSS